MHFATHVRTWRVARLYKVPCTVLFGIGHVHIYNILLRLTDNVTSQNTDLFSWDGLCSIGCVVTRTTTNDGGGNFSTDL
jgi:hypothetical protein